MENIKNRLALEKSPYLLQHAANPVDWHPWKPEAFEKARRENKPVFLSIGYSTCHWCHVMAHESFEDPQVAALLNESFVSIKVDREERPDIDGAYMTVCQILTGGGGWPLSIFMTPEGRPFFAGTYFPKESRFNQIGLLDLLPRLQKMWETRKDEILRSSEELIRQLRQIHDHPPAAGLGPAVLETAYHQLDQRFDEGYGGFGHAPKFPTPHNFLFLLRAWKRGGKERALRMTERSLQKMRRGGVYDQIGFGFHRYSVDREWMVPHFEKMLYDQAMTAMAYTETFQAAQKPEHRETAREILDYCLRDLRSEHGAFFCSEDADSEGREGKFYVWAESELDQILSPDEAAFLKRACAVKPEGNFREEASGTFAGANILYIADPATDPFSNPVFQSARRKLFEARLKRVRPHRDEKILTDWNGLMIAALAKAARLFAEPRYAQAAGEALAFIFGNLRTPDGRLLHRWCGGEASVPAFLDDYAFLVWGLLEMYQDGFDPNHLKAALDLNEALLAHFWDEEEGGFYFTADDAEAVLLRNKDVYDGAVPSGNSAAFLNLLRLARISGRSDLEEKAFKLNRAFAPLVSHAPAAYTQFLCALDFALGSSEIVLCGDPESDEIQEILEILRNEFLPNTVLLLRSSENSGALAALAPFTKDLQTLSGKPAVYVCANGRCGLPSANIRQALERLPENPR